MLQIVTRNHHHGHHGAVSVYGDGPWQKQPLSFGEDIGHETPAHLERLIFKSK